MAGFRIPALEHESSFPISLGLITFEYLGIPAHCPHPQQTIFFPACPPEPPCPPQRHRGRQNSHRLLLFSDLEEHKGHCAVPFVVCFRNSSVWTPGSSTARTAPIAIGSVQPLSTFVPFNILKRLTKFVGLTDSRRDDMHACVFGR